MHCFDRYYKALIFRRIDSNGELLLEKIYRTEDESSLREMVVTPSGEVFIAGYGTHLAPSEEFVAELDAAFEEVHVHSNTALKCISSPSLASDESGKAWTFCQHVYEGGLIVADYALSRIAPGGGIEAQIPVDVEGDKLHALAATSDALYLSGSTFLYNDAIFLTLAIEGAVLQEEIYDSRVPLSVSAIAIAPNGDAYGAGMAAYGEDRKLFITPWLPL